MRLDTAERIALRLVEEMREGCERVEIAGSVRRRKDDVKDIEIVAVPKFVAEPLPQASLFDTEPRTRDVNLLHRWALQSEVRWIKTGTSAVEDWRIDPDGKYWRGLVDAGGGARVKLDLFIARPANFGLIYLIRTGAKDFSEAVLGHAKRATPYQTEWSYYDERPHLPGKAETGWMVERATGRRVDLREEEDVFDLLGLQFVEPRLREDGGSLRRKAGPAAHGVRHVSVPRPR